MFMARREACSFRARREACVPSARREACAFPHLLVELVAMAFPWSGVLLAVIALRQTAVSSGDHRVGGPQWISRIIPMKVMQPSWRYTWSIMRDYASGDHCDGEPLYAVFSR